MIKHGICIQTLIPVRSEPKESAEMATQLIFGELYRIIEFDSKWANIESIDDNYNGWIDAKIVTEINEEKFKKLNDVQYQIVSDPISFIENNEEEKMPLVAGSIFYNNSEKGFVISNSGFTKPNQAVFKKSDIEILSRRFLNAPYLWGGKSILGIDCSGLTQLVYKILGTQLPRNASQQASIGQSISFINESQSGDLAFFDNDEGNIIHVGIILKNSQIIHASGHVRIDKIDHQGIFNIDTQKYTHKLRIIKRVK